jgi:aquaporin Z
VENKPTPYLVRELSPSATLADAIALHWPEYLFEGLELGAFMLAACAFGTLLFYSESPVEVVFRQDAVEFPAGFLGLLTRTSTYSA